MADPLLDYGAPDPEELRRRAAANVAADNAALDRVNAASRVITPFEGYARVAQYQEPGTEARTTYGAPPATVNLRPAADTYDLSGPASGTIDYTGGTTSGAIPYVSTSAQPYGTAGNIGVEPPAPVEPVPTVTDAHLQDIADRRTQNADQRKQLMVELGMLPPSAGGFVAITLPSNRDYVKKLSMLRGLEDEDRAFLQEQHYAAVERGRANDENLKRELHVQAATDYGDLANDVLNVRKQFKGNYNSPDYQDALTAAIGRHKEGASTKAGIDLINANRKQQGFQPLSADQIRQAIQNWSAATRQSPGSIEMTAGGGIRIGTAASTSKPVTPKQFEDKLNGLGLTPYDFENSELWKPTPDGTKVFRKAESIGNRLGKTITLNADTYNQLQGQYNALYGKTNATTGAETTVTSQADYDALPSGATFIFNGKRGKKP